MCQRRFGTLVIGLAGGCLAALAGSAAAQTGLAETGEVLRRLQTQSGVEVNLGTAGGVEVKVPDTAAGRSTSPFSRLSDAAVANSDGSTGAESTRVERDRSGIRVSIPSAAARDHTPAFQDAERADAASRPGVGPRVNLPAGIDRMIESLVPELRLGADGASIQRNDLRADTSDGFAVEMDTPEGRVVVNQQGLEAYAAAVRAFRERDYPMALQHADAAVEAMPQMAKFAQFRGLARFTMNEFTAAAEDVYQALRMGPAWDWPTVTEFYMKSADYASRYRDLQRAAKADPESAELQFLVAYHHMMLGHHDAALAAWQRTDQLLPDDSVVTAQLRRLQERPAPIHPAD